MNNPAKIGITGIGGYGWKHLEAFLEEQEQGAVELSAAVVRSPQRNAEQLAALTVRSPGVHIFPTLDDIAVNGVQLDLMVLPVGIGVHRELTLKSLDAGWNVLLEKPLAGSMEDSMAIVKAAESSDRFVAVGYQDMYDPEIRAMKATLCSGTIGAVRAVRVFGVWGRPVEYYARTAWAGRLFYNEQPVFDSPINNAMAHYLNMALYLAGRDMNSVAMPVDVEGSLWRAHKIESCDTACLRWPTDAGPDVSVLFSHASATTMGPELIVEGTRGSLFWRIRSHWELSADGKPPVRHELSLTQASQRQQMIKDVLRRCSDPSVSVYTPRQALPQVQAVELAHRKLQIRDFPAHAVRCSSGQDSQGNLCCWMQVTGLKEAGKDFLSGTAGADDLEMYIRQGSDTGTTCP